MAHTRFPLPIFIIFLSLFGAALLSVMPFLIWLRLPWLLMIVMSWLLIFPNYCGLGAAWLTGLFADVLYDSLFGLHALAFTLVAYLLLKYRVRINVFPYRQKILLVMGILFLYRVFFFCIEAAMGHFPNSHFYWFSPIIGALLWPGLYALMRSYSHSHSHSQNIYL